MSCTVRSADAPVVEITGHVHHLGRADDPATATSTLRNAVACERHNEQTGDDLGLDLHAGAGAVIVANHARPERVPSGATAVSPDQIGEIDSSSAAAGSCERSTYSSVLVSRSAAVRSLAFTAASPTSSLTSAAPCQRQRSRKRGLRMASAVRTRSGSGVGGVTGHPHQSAHAMSA